MKAFEQPFSTGEATLRKEKAGVGVGLHLARQIVVEHGGMMWSDPLPGGGTRVSFCIPIERRPTARGPARQRRRRRLIRRSSVASRVGRILAPGGSTAGSTVRGARCLGSRAPSAAGAGGLRPLPPPRRSDVEVHPCLGVRGRPPSCRTTGSRRRPTTPRDSFGVAATPGPGGCRRRGPDGAGPDRHLGGRDRGRACRATSTTWRRPGRSSRGCTTPAMHARVDEQVYADHAPAAVTGRRARRATTWRDGEGTCWTAARRRGGRTSSRRPGSARAASIGIPRSGLYVVVAATPDGAAVQRRLLAQIARRHVRFGDDGIAGLPPTRCTPAV